jgi:glycerol-3-phosphate dehydrogenase
MLATNPGSQLEPRAAGGHIEAIDMAQRVAHYGGRLGIDTPVTLAISKVLSGEMKAADAMHELMARHVGKE